MSVRELSLGLVLLTALALITYGVSGWSMSAAYITGGIGLAGLGALFLVEAD